MPPISADAISTGSPGTWQSANHFRLTRYNSENTKKLSASQSRDCLIAGQSDSDRRVVGQCSGVLALPSGSGGVFAARHIERRQLPSLDADHFDRHRDRPPEPAEPSAVGDNELDVAGGRAHDLADETKRRRTLVEHRQADQVADAHGV